MQCQSVRCTSRCVCLCPSRLQAHEWIEARISRFYYHSRVHNTPFLWYETIVSGRRCCCHSVVGRRLSRRRSNRIKAIHTTHSRPPINVTYTDERTNGRANERANATVWRLHALRIDKFEGAKEERCRWQCSVGRVRIRCRGTSRRRCRRSQKSWDFFFLLPNCGRRGWMGQFWSQTEFERERGRETNIARQWLP